MFAIFGATGQAVYNWADARNSEQAEKGGSDKKNFILNSKWSPMKVLSDNVDENIEALRAQERQLAAENDKRLPDPKDTSSK
jgi:hypothetical protein